MGGRRWRRLGGGSIWIRFRSFRGGDDVCVCVYVDLEFRGGWVGLLNEDRENTQNQDRVRIKRLPGSHNYSTYTSERENLCLLKLL
jgi:hypothetical protein